MKVYKFGGASVKDAEGIKRLAEIVASSRGELIVVVSAMDKTTNALEKLVPKTTDAAEAEKIICEIEAYHFRMAKEVKEPYASSLYQTLQKDFTELRTLLNTYPDKDEDERYDAIVSMGEIISTHIINAYLNGEGLSNEWADARILIMTDDCHRDARVDFPKTEVQVNTLLLKAFNGKKIVVTQGFIGSSQQKHTTTLGREGSDYSAAIMAYCTHAESVTIWKDVPGVLNADPRKFNDAIKLDHLNYQDAIELSYYGASVIHPKTIKPLQNKNIPLLVKSFLNPAGSGTFINNDEKTHLPIPCFISKSNQMLLSLSPKDFSFIAEDNLSFIFDSFAKLKLKVNMMQRSAINFSVCFDNSQSKLPGLLAIFHDNYRVLYNENVELFTIRYYNQATIDKITAGRNILVEQRSRYTVQLVLK